MHIRRQFLEQIAQTSEISQQFEISRAAGYHLYDTDGREYIDLISGFGVNNIGHGVDEVKNAIQEQSNLYLHSNVYGEHIQSPQLKLAELLISLLPKGLNSCYFLNSGSECIDAAIKLARLATGRAEIVVCKKAYHGSTLGAESLRSDALHKMGFLPLVPGIRFIEFNKESDLDTITSATALVITEVIQTEAGVREASSSYWQGLRQRCNEVNCLLAVDEIQTGLGRTGKLFAFQREAFIPDILLCGKALGAGMPLSAMLCDQTLMHYFSKKLPLAYITTFGGHPVCCAAGYAGLNYLIKNQLIESATHKEQIFRSYLDPIGLEPLRGKGLLLAMEINNSFSLMTLLQSLYKQQILAESFLFCPTALRIAPPLNLNEEEIEGICTKIINAYSPAD